jgi:hypothetical protein
MQKKKSSRKRNSFFMIADHLKVAITSLFFLM